MPACCVMVGIAILSPLLAACLVLAGIGSVASLSNQERKELHTKIEEELNKQKAAAQEELAKDIAAAKKALDEEIAAGREELAKEKKAALNKHQTALQECYTMRGEADRKMRTAHEQAHSQRERAKAIQKEWNQAKKELHEKQETYLALMTKRTEPVVPQEKEAELKKIKVLFVDAWKRRTERKGDALALELLLDYLNTAGCEINPFREDIRRRQIGIKYWMELIAMKHFTEFGLSPTNAHLCMQHLIVLRKAVGYNRIG